VYGRHFSESTTNTISRCITFGVRCGGYQTTLSRTHLETSNILLSTRLLQSYQTESPRELRALEYYLLKVAPRMNGYYHKSLWSERIPALSLREPAIRSALIAFSALYELHLSTDENLSLPEEARTFAIESYNQAIRKLVPQLESENMRIPLTMCLIFSCIETVRGLVDAALNHLRAGLRLMVLWRARYTTAITTGCTSELYTDFDFIENTISPVFGWLSTMMRYYGEDVPSKKELFTPPRLPSIPSSPEPMLSGTIQNLDDIATNLAILASRAVEFAYSFGKLAHSEEPDIETLIQHRDLILSFEAWTSFFHRRLQEHGYTDQHEYAPAKVMIAGHRATQIWIQGYFYNRETQWDHAKEHFETIVQLLEESIGDPNRWVDQYSKFFSFEPGYAATLHFVISKCRWPGIRRRALRILRACPRRESMFDSLTLLTLYERVMEIEESGIAGLKGQEPTNEQLPPEKSRIHNIEIAPLPRTVRGHTVNFYFQSFSDLPVRAEFLDLKSNWLAKCMQKGWTCYEGQHMSQGEQLQIVDPL
jgi:hypothetical protein